MIVAMMTMIGQNDDSDHADRNGHSGHDNRNGHNDHGNDDHSDDGHGDHNGRDVTTTTTAPPPRPVQTTVLLQLRVFYLEKIINSFQG